MTETIKKKIFSEQFIFGLIGLIATNAVYKLLYGIMLPILLNSHMFFYEWVQMFYFPDKKYQIIAFVLSMAFMACYCFLIYFLKRLEYFSKILAVIRSARVSTAGMIVYIVGIIVFICLLNTFNLFAFITCVFFILAICFFLYKSCILSESGLLNSNNLKKIMWVSIFLGAAQLFYMFWPYLVGDIRLINEFAEIPEKTLIGGRYIDNSIIFNDQNIVGFHRKNIDDNKIHYSKVNKTYLSTKINLSSFVEEYDEKYEYNDKTGELSLYADMTEKELNFLMNLVNSDRDKNQILEMYLRSEKIKKNRIFLSREKLQSAKNNLFEILWQIQNRWMIHHHSYVYIPILELAKGKAFNKIYMQYGLINTLVLKTILKSTGAISFHKYFQVWYAVFCLYYLFFGYLLIRLFKGNVLYVFMAWIGTISILNMIGFQFLSLGPGLNPIRHFVDIFVILFLLRYINPDDIFGKNHLVKILFLIFMAVMATLNNYETGTSLTLALLGSLFVVCLFNKERISLIQYLYFCGFILIFLIVLSFLLRSEYNPLSSYYFNGLLGFPFNSILIVIIFFISIISYLIIYYLLKNEHRLRHVILFLFFYSQALTVYVIWGATRYHFYNFAPILFLFIILLLYSINDCNPNLLNMITKNRLLVKVYVVGSVLLGLIASSALFYISKVEYTKVFEENRVYEWKFPSAKVKSTINPEYFSSCIELINKYSGNEKGIYILSKYDQILTILSEKYSNMPYFDMAWYLISEKELRESADLIENERPQYLYVDKNLADKKLIVSKNSFFSLLYEESLSRYKRLKKMEVLFENIKSEYEKIDGNKIMNVYVRKGDASRNASSRIYSPPKL